MRYYKRLPLEKMSNCRDLGGYPTKSGKITNFGVFVRSEAPVSLTKSDIKFLKDYNIKRSIDFRGDDDLKKFPSSLNIKGFEYIHLPMFGRADALGFDDKVDPSEGFTGWGKNYIIWLESFKGWVRDVIHQIATCKGACQYNCNAGKDRTGIISGLILMLGEVEENDIAFDYCISRAMLKPRFADLTKQWAGMKYLMDEQGRLIANHPFLYTPKSAMEQMIKYINTEYKSAENYLLSCNIDKKDIAEIRHKLLG